MEKNNHQKTNSSTMKKIIIICILSIAFNFKLSAQKVFSVDYSSQADLKVFVVKYESQADLNVYKVKYQSFSNNQPLFQLIICHLLKITKECSAFIEKIRRCCLIKIRQRSCLRYLLLVVIS
jgi:hypothetical protein